MVGDFRPIACCNVIYKVISKVISNRLAKVLDRIIEKSQSAFVGGRLITDNIHLVENLMRHYERKRIYPRCVLKMDLRKAYDSVDWTFLESVLMGLQFPARFVRWIMQCVSSVSFTVKVNGETKGFFPGMRGLRQGDPLSPYLFVICMEYLSRLLNIRAVEGDFNFHPRCDKLKLTHLTFADDLMLFARGNIGSVRILANTVDEFGRVSGLRANNLKSNLYLAGVKAEDRVQIEAEFQFASGSFPFRYLGIPLAASTMRVLDYQPLLDKISSVINVWTGQSLSYAGRLEILKTVVKAIGCFWLSIFSIPQGVIEHIYHICKVFLWGKRASKVAWDEVFKPKKEGGKRVLRIALFDLVS